MRICIISAFEDSMQYDSGYSVRIVNVAKGLMARGNSVSVIMPKYRASRRFVDKIPVYEMNGFCPQSLLKLIGKVANIAKPSALYFFDALFVVRSARFVEKADIVQIEQPALCILLSSFIRKTLKKPVAIDCHDVFQALRLKHTGLVRRILETFLEKIALKNADLLITVSEKERDILLSMGFPSKKIIVAPNGVNTASFARPPDLQTIRSRYGFGDSRIVVFMGNLTYIPNQQAVKLISSIIAPKVRKEVNNAKFLVVGKNREEMKLRDITFTGYVDNVAEVLAISDVGIAPLLEGAGTRLKILEYLSTGLPVVSTSVGAEGLVIENGYNIIIEDNIEHFAYHIIQLLKNDTLSSSMGEAGKVAAANYDWKKITDKLHEDYSCFFSKMSSKSTA